MNVNHDDLFRPLRDQLTGTFRQGRRHEFEKSQFDGRIRHAQTHRSLNPPHRIGPFRIRGHRGRKRIRAVVMVYLSRKLGGLSRPPPD